MKNLFPPFARQRFYYFRVTYTTDYRSLTVAHIATDSQHPLYEAQRRRQQARPREGLWWHVTTGFDLSKISCVRTWARRRLRNAFIEELQCRGFDESGYRVLPLGVEHGQSVLRDSQQGKSLHLAGSLRLHVQAALISAKYAEVRAEVGQIVATLQEAVLNESVGPGFSTRPLIRQRLTFPSHSNSRR